MPLAWESETGEESWSDREAWRGDEHAEVADQWQSDSTEEFVWASEEDDSEPAAEDEDWPEDLAGPEYWMFKDMDE